MRLFRRVLLVLALGLFALSANGCGDPAPKAPPSEAVAKASDPQVFQEVQERLDRIIAEASERYRPMECDQAEDLMRLLDRISQRLSGRFDPNDPRILPHLSEAEEQELLLGCINRWKNTTGKTPDAVLPGLLKMWSEAKLDDALREEFRTKANQAMGGFLTQVQRSFQRQRNLVIRERSKPLFDQYRERHPLIAAYFEASLNTPQFAIFP